MGCLALASRLPLDTLLAAGRALGTLLFHLLPARRRVARTNVALAFPDTPRAERERIVRESFRESGAAIAETVCVWFRPPSHYRERLALEGTAHVDAALARGRGVIILQAHFTCIDICAPSITARWPAGAVYDAPKNPLYAALLAWQRGHWIAPMIDNRDIRAMVRHLRRGGIVWYSPDQSVSARHGGIRTRYFDQPVLSTAGTARIVSMTGAAVIPHLPIRDPASNRYTLRFLAPIALPEGDARAATQAVNDLLEQHVRAQPDQYLWVHKRFKPPAPDLPNPYRRAS